MTNEKGRETLKELSQMLADGAETIGIPGLSNARDRKWNRLNRTTRRWIVTAALKGKSTDAEMEAFASGDYSAIPKAHRVAIRLRAERIRAEISRVTDALRIHLTDEPD